MKLNGRVLNESEIVAATLENKKVWHMLTCCNVFTIEEIEKYFNNIDWDFYCSKLDTSNYDVETIMNIFQRLLDRNMLSNTSIRRLCVTVPMDKEFILKNKDKLNLTVVFLSNEKAEKFTKTEKVKYGLVKVPKVGELCTQTIGSDSYPFEVVEVSKSGLQCKIRRLDATPAEGFDYYTHQEYVYSSNENNPTKIVKMNSRGLYTNNKLRIKFGYAIYYKDPSF